MFDTYILTKDQNINGAKTNIIWIWQRSNRWNIDFTQKHWWNDIKTIKLIKSNKLFTIGTILTNTHTERER